MNTEKIQMYTVVSYNKARTVIFYNQMSLRQLESIFPKYVVGILVKGLSHLLSIDGKFKKYYFSYITIDSTNCLAVNIGLKRYIKLFPAGSFNVLQKMYETEVKQKVPVSKKIKETTTPGSKAPMRVIYRLYANVPTPSCITINSLLYTEKLINYYELNKDIFSLENTALKQSSVYDIQMIINEINKDFNVSEKMLDEELELFKFDEIDNYIVKALVEKINKIKVVIKPTQTSGSRHN